MTDYRPVRGRPLLVAVGVFVGLYVGAQQLGDVFRTPDGVSIWFPPAALGFALLVIAPWRIGLSTFVATRVLLAVAAGTASPLLLTTINAVSVGVAYLLAALMFRAVAHPGRLVHDVRSTAAFLICGVGIGPLLASLATRAAVALSGRAPWSDYWQTVLDFWVGDAVAVATLVPLFWALWMLQRSRVALQEALELSSVTAAAVAVGWLAVRVDVGGSAPLYAVFVPLLVLAIRQGLLGAAVGVPVVALVMVGGEAVGLASVSVSATHAFLISMSVVTLSVGAVQMARRDATSDLALSEQRHRQMVEVIRDHSIYLLDADGHIATWNEGATRLTGYRADDAVGRPVADLFTAEDRELGVPDELLATALRDERAQTETWRMRQDGSQFWAEVSLSRLVGDDGEVVGFTEVVRDLTEQRAAQLALEQRTAELEHSNEDLDRFASIASHDLQEPLRMVASYTELLRRKYGPELNEDARELIDYAVDGARRMRDLITDLLRFSRVNTRPDQDRNVDLAATLALVERDLGLALEETGGRIVADDLPTVRGDPTQLKMLFENIIGNALKYRGEQPPMVRITAQCQDDGAWLFGIADNGIGVHPDDLETMFEPFRRLQGRTDYPGTGIGLAICRRVVERHGGEIWAEPNTQGLTMWFTLRATADRVGSRP